MCLVKSGLPASARAAMVRLYERYNAEKVDEALVGQRVRDGERADVVDVEAEVRVDDELDRRRGGDGVRSTGVTARSSSLRAWRRRPSASS